MDVRCVFLLAVLSAFTFANVRAWSGNSCSRVKCRYYYQRVCRFRFWGICCSYKTVRRTAYYIQRFCCPGWRHSGNENCNIPVCTPPCKNGGTCISPGRCRCTVQFSGERCDGAVCSHVSPCYPGTCLPNAQCDCASGFTSAGSQRSDTCRKIEDNANTDLQIYAMQVRMSYWPRHKNPPMEDYWIMADSTALDESQMDYFWTNQKDFNRLETTCSSQFFPPENIPQKPVYVRNGEFGIVLGKVDVYLSKLPIPPETRRFPSLNTTINCAESVSSNQPETTLYECNITDRNFDRFLEHGDFLRVTYRTEGGGYRELMNRNDNPPTQYAVEDFETVKRELSVEFRFDFLKPYHCGMRGTCQGGARLMLDVPDITTSSPIQITWGGWLDSDSKVFRYAVEVFKLSKTIDGGLEIKPDQALKPLRIWEVLESNMAAAQPQEFDFTEGGMYSVVLEVADVANNSIYVQRYCLYDPRPTITFDPDHDLYVSSASSAANYSYQSDTGVIRVTWSRHFRNAFHEDNALLGPIRRYPPSLVEFKKNIPRNQSLDDSEGNRTYSAIPNERGIVQFFVGYGKDSEGGRNSTVSTIPPSGWNELGLRTTYTVPPSLSPSRGDTVTVWVRARDITGHEVVDFTKVSFDATEPNIMEMLFKTNEYVPGIDYSSRFQLSTEDAESGVAYVIWTFTRRDGRVLYQEQVPGKTVESCADKRVCDCTPAGDCFSYDQSYGVSNCHMMVEKDSLSTEQVTVTANVTNMAGLVKQSTFTVPDLTVLNGTQAYYPPQNITPTDITGTSVSLSWTFPLSCFERTALWVVVDGQMRPVHKDARQFDVTGLDCETEYTIFMVTDFDGEYKSDKAPVTFTTAGGCGLGAGAIAGIVIGLLILLALIVLIVVFVLYRRRVILQQPGPVNKQLNRMSHAFDNARRFTTRRKDPERAFSNSAYRSDEDEVYLYGHMAFNTHQNWQLADSDLTLLDHVAEGKFANIYKATWRHDGRSDTVAAKMLKPGFSEDDALKMMAKVNFFATAFEDHDNVIRFLGAVTDNTSWGPVLVMEYCENGQMDKWLTAQRSASKFTEQSMEQLMRFSLGVAKGMEYLASKGITHRRLAARNILLTFILDVKIAGFGPQHKDGSDDKMTRVPAKWAAPEVLEEKPATEKSDVWSFGVVLWEIFSMGQVPYPTIHANQIGSRLKGGYRMEKPEYADEIHYELMKECWQYRQSKRPTFKTIRTKLEQHFAPGNRQSVDFYYEANQLHGP